MEFQTIFNNEEKEFVKFMDRFYLSIQLTKSCAKSCGIISNSHSGVNLNDTEISCIGIFCS